MKNVIVLFSLLTFVTLSSSAADYTRTSALANGKCVQLKVTEDAIYKLTYEDLKNQGFNDPSKIKLYGYGGWVLDQDFTKPYVDDLPEVAVYLNKGSDNVFGPGDYLLFYGRGVVKWTYNTANDFFTHENNSYSLYGSYFIVENEQGPKELPLQTSYTNTTAVVTDFDDYRLHEKDLVAVLHSGRELFGESFVGNPSQKFSFNIPGITNDPGEARLSFAAAPAVQTPAVLSIGEEQLKVNINAVSGAYTKADLQEKALAWKGDKTENVTVNISYNSAGQSVAFLNFISLNMKRKLRFYNEPYTFFRNKDSRTKALEYWIENAASNYQVWNITDIQNIRQVQTSLEGAILHFGADKENGISEYVLVDVNNGSFPALNDKTGYLTSVKTEVKNQNLHGLDPVDMVIIAPEAYFPYAETLAEKHRSLQGLTVAVVQPEWVYNEFSSGTPDATAYRRFMKMFYDRATQESEKPQYLLLYGDGYYDNRHLTVDGAKLDPNYYLLSYQFKNSVNETFSYGTDDYFGFLDDKEGINLSDDKLDIGIGRFPVNTQAQAENVMKKVIAYMENTHYSSWKNTVIFTADDTDSSFGYCWFAKGADTLAGIVEKNSPQYMVVKSYMDAFQPVDLNGKRTYPDAKQKLMNTLKDGCFLFNYTGHGSPSSMSAKDMMNTATIRQMTFNSLPLWITATCDFGRYDDDKTSAGEEVFLNKKSAGIALFTTTRVVYGTPNQMLNELLISRIFAKTAEGKRPALGDIIRQSKIDAGSGDNKLNFILLGDPALKLNYPEWEVVLESINDQPVQENETSNFKALEQMNLKGVVVDGNGNPMDDFTGHIQATVFDGKQTIQPVTPPYGEGQHWSFSDFPNIVYKGTAPVENGHFSVSFKVPLDISYAANPGKMNFYAWNENQHTDAAGSFLNYTLSGTADHSNLNELGPEIEPMFLNTPLFQNGDNVNEAPFFYAEVFDEDGINRTGSGLGHDLTICIDNNPAWTYNLNGYFQSGELNGSGSVGFSIPELPAGQHQLVFKAWDILNNSSTDSLSFHVIKGLKPEIHTITAAPNPAKERTEFLLGHDRPENVLEVEIRVYDLTGRAIWSYLETGSSAYQRSYSVEWDLRTGAGNRVTPGIYVYQAVIKTTGGKEATKSKKLIVL
jgi:hypothetical protein